jgi:3-oxoacyl-[acyl-carrier protein] reductase
MMDLNLNGKRAMVCGSTQGIGRAAAQELAAMGAEVILVARDATKLQAVVAALPSPAGQTHHYLVADFSHPAQLREALANYALSHPDPIHILVNNTGGPPGGATYSADIEEFRAAFNQHLVCNHLLVQACLAGMKAAGYGRIINVISTSVKQPLDGLGVSNTIRGAVANWAKSLANELGSYGITVNNVLPGATETERLQAILDAKVQKTGISAEEAAGQMLAAIPAKRFAQPEEIAYAIAFLASPSASYITGINLPVDGGRTKSL